MACSIHPMPHRPTAWTHAPPGHSRTSPAPATPPRPATRGTERAARRSPRPGRGHYTEKTARPRRYGGQPDELRQGQGFGRAGVQPSKQRRRVRAPPPEPGPVRDAFFQHGLHARTEARSLGEQAVSLVSVLFSGSMPGSAQWSASPPPGLRASLSVSDGSSSGRNTVSSSCHPLGRTPVIRRVRFTLHPIRSAAVSIVPSSTPTPSRRVSRCLSDQFISSDFLLSSFACEPFDKPCTVMALKPMSNRGSSEKTEARHCFAPRSLFGMDGLRTGEPAR